MPRARKFRNLYISSIYQNAGKTTVALGLYKLFREHDLDTAFLKPVGQQTVPVKNQNIDKDSYLMGEVYRCHKRLADMSPVTIGHGFTEKYVFHPRNQPMLRRIHNAFQSLTRGKDAIIIEGTGHSGVGSVIDLSNADVARMLGSKVLIISEGGIGRAIDEIMLNKALFDLQKVEILGVIINKVLPEKYKKIKKVISRGLRNKGLRLLGVIPLDPILRDPTMEHLMNKLQLALLSGEENLNRRVRNTIVAAMEPENMVNYISEGTLVLTSGDRVDNIMVAVSAHLIQHGKRSQVSGIILTGGLTPSPKIVELLKESKIPVLTTEDDTYTVAGKVDGFICKIEKNDKEKILEARQLVKKHVEIDQILRHL